MMHRAHRHSRCHGQLLHILCLHCSSSISYLLPILEPLVQGPSDPGYKPRVVSARVATQKSVWNIPLGALQGNPGIHKTPACPLWVPAGKPHGVHHCTPLLCIRMLYLYLIKSSLGAPQGIPFGFKMASIHYVREYDQKNP